MIIPNYKRALTSEDYKRINIGTLYHDASLDAIPDTASYKKVILGYNTNIARHLKNGEGLMLWGPYSAGKSYIAASLAKEVVSRGGTAYVVDSREGVKIDIEKPIFEEDETVKERLLSVDLLVIDDLGVISEGYAVLWTDALIRKRTSQKKAIVITTNLGPKELSGVMGNKIFEVLKEASYPVQISGTNWREKRGIAIADSFKEYL